MAQKEGAIDSPMRVAPGFGPDVARPPGTRQAAQFKPACGNYPKPPGDFPIAASGKLVMRRNKRVRVRESRVLQQTTSGLQPVCNFGAVSRIKFERLVMQSVLHHMIPWIRAEILRQRAAAVER